MKSIKLLVTICSAATILCTANATHAEMTPADAARLGKDLTPNGAEAAGNKEGTIPAWTGGLAKPPAGWKPEMGYIDPFLDEKPLFVINAQNVEQHKDKLAPGAIALLKKYPNFRMPVYPTHRTFAYPQSVYDATKAQATKTKMDGEKIVDFKQPATPFPNPKTGVEAIFNTITRWYGAMNRCTDWLPVRPNGDYYRVGFCEEFIQRTNFVDASAIPPGLMFGFYGYYDAPSALVGTIYMAHDPYQVNTDPREVWIYNAGQRRVRRAPDFGYDNYTDGTEGMVHVDTYFGFNGGMDRYNWKLLGKKEMYVPYNAYRLNDPKLKYADMLDKGHLKSDLFRYELHRVWVVEATLKENVTHQVHKRVLYLDEDSYLVAMEDLYDGRGNLWRAMLLPMIQAYDAPTMLPVPQIVHDLSNGSFIVLSIANERKQPFVTFGGKGKWSDFQIDAIRRKGTR